MWGGQGSDTSRETWNLRLTLETSWSFVLNPEIVKPRAPLKEAACLSHGVVLVVVDLLVLVRCIPHECYLLSLTPWMLPPPLMNECYPLLHRCFPPRRLKAAKNWTCVQTFNFAILTWPKFKLLCIDWNSSIFKISWLDRKTWDRPSCLLHESRLAMAKSWLDLETTEFAPTGCGNPGILRRRFPNTRKESEKLLTWSIAVVKLVFFGGGRSPLAWFGSLKCTCSFVGSCLSSTPDLHLRIDPCMGREGLRIHQDEISPVCLPLSWQSACNRSFRGRGPRRTGLGGWRGERF